MNRFDRHIAAAWGSCVKELLEDLPEPTEAELAAEEAEEGLEDLLVEEAEEESVFDDAFDDDEVPSVEYAAESVDQDAETVAYVLRQATGIDD